MARRERFRLSPIPGSESVQWLLWAMGQYKAQGLFPDAPDREPGITTDQVRMACVACARRLVMQVALDCPACQGYGLLEFDYDETLYETADDACHAVARLLEQAARVKLEPNPTAQGIADARDAVRLLADAIRSGGLGAELANVPITEPSLLDAPPLAFDYDDKPLEAGGIPNFSREGYPSFLMRACDPLDPLDMVDGNTMRRVTERQRIRREARILAKALLMSDEERLRRR